MMKVASRIWPTETKKVTNYSILKYIKITKKFNTRRIDDCGAIYRWDISNRRIFPKYIRYGMREDRFILSDCDNVITQSHFMKVTELWVNAIGSIMHIYADRLAAEKIKLLIKHKKNKIVQQSACAITSKTQAIARVYSCHIAVCVLMLRL